VDVTDDDDHCCSPTPTDKETTMPGAPLSLPGPEEIAAALIEHRSPLWAAIV